jgi:hypothetical protein
MDAKT